MVSRMLRLSNKFIVPIFERLYKYDVSGIENLLDGPSVIAMNQSSILDVFTLNGGILSKIERPMIFVARSYPRFMFGLTDYYLKKLGYVVVPESNRAGIKALRSKAPKILKAGSHLGIFPEGVRIRERKLGHFYLGAAYVAIDSKKPIVPVFMTDLYDTKFGGEVYIRIGSPIYDDGEGKNGGRAKRLIDRVRDAIMEMSDYS